MKARTKTALKKRLEEIFARIVRRRESSLAVGPGMRVNENYGAVVRSSETGDVGNERRRESNAHAIAKEIIVRARFEDLADEKPRSSTVAPHDGCRRK